jgi:hypothetical protein
MPQAVQPQCDDAPGRPVGRWAGWWLRADPRPLLLLALLLSLAFCWVYRCPTVAMVGPAYHYDFWLGSFLFGLLAAGRCVQLLACNAYEARLGARSRSRRRFWPWLAVLAAGTYLLLWLQLPMQAGFLVSRPALDGLADEALADPAKAHLLAGRWAGLYRVAGVEVLGKTVVLYLGKDRGSYGFARVPGAAGDVVFNRPGLEGDPRNRRDFPRQANPEGPQGERMAGDWFVMYSWYWLVKVGWS